MSRPFCQHQPCNSPQLKTRRTSTTTTRQSCSDLIPVELHPSFICTSSFVQILMTLATYIIYHNWSQLLYAWKALRRHQLPDRQRDFTKDAYFVYADTDRDVMWACLTLPRLLRQHRPVRILLRNQEEMVGSDKAESIALHIETSWKVSFFSVFFLLLYLILSYLSRSLADRWGTTGDFTTSFLHSSRFSAFRSVIFQSRPVHSFMLSSHRFLCLPLCLRPCTVPCRIVLASPDDLVYIIGRKTAQHFSPTNVAMTFICRHCCW